MSPGCFRRPALNPLNSVLPFEPSPVNYGKEDTMEFDVTAEQKQTLDALHRDHPDMMVAHMSDAEEELPDGIDPETVAVRDPEGTPMYAVEKDGTLINLLHPEEE